MLCNNFPLSSLSIIPIGLIILGCIFLRACLLVSIIAILRHTPANCYHSDTLQHQHGYLVGDTFIYEGMKENKKQVPIEDST